ncbi:MAG: superoxide dismutase, Ni [Candidatus Eisenbacteria bacterium]|uniref:Superoxide dismutase, Ni n=1 Tax=Eiseniibacteriota bacterium TaxID=2212470 RepID=A0A948W769_UNCEI|nr:superoxide dismutase, Ni [Candidatus Eisenbacteria bacterium]MBU1947985.1 superoxide dismutase, Ni [Candidatus Eisenbacteria bacterium]MBU2692274.1 superoxide dismutase, Ni [Candidatus Eisenbacteria bacterium]
MPDNFVHPTHEHPFSAGAGPENFCAGPCVVHDPASARIAAETVVVLTRNIKTITRPIPDDPASRKAYHNALTHYIHLKAQQADRAKHELLTLWADYFTIDHFTEFPKLSESIWNAAQLATEAKQEVNEETALQLLDAVREIHNIFWKTKGREAPWITTAV